MAVITTNLTCDLQKAVKVQYLDGVLFSQDNQANQISVAVFDNGEPASISGTVTADIIRSDGGTVAASGGTIEDNIASITLPAAAYAVPGIVSICVKLTADSVVTTIAAIIANMYRSSTDTTVDPGTIIPSIQSLITQIETAVATIPADYSSLWTSLAPAFNSSSSYLAGQYVTYDGAVYKFTADHSGSWSSDDVTSANIGTDLGELTKSFNYLNDDFIKEAVTEFGTVDIGTPTSGHYIKKADGLINSNTSSAWTYSDFIAISGKALLFTCPEHSNNTTLGAVASMAFYSSASTSGFTGDTVDLIKGTTGSYRFVIVNVPAGAKYFRSSIPASISYTYQVIDIDSFANVYSKISEIQTILDDTKVLQSINTITSFGGTGDTYADLTELPDNSLCRTTNGPDRPDEIAANNGFWVLTAKAKNVSTWVQIGFSSRTGDVYIRYKGTSTSSYTSWNTGTKKKDIKILCIGNSFTLDNLSYMPFILENVSDEINLTLTFAFYPSSTIDNHIAAFENDTVEYFKCVHKTGTTAWTVPSERDSTLKQILASDQWDFITFQQASGSQANWNTYANLNTLIDKVVSYVNSLGNHSVRLGWLMPQVRTSLESTYPTVMENVQKVLQTTPIDFVIPCGTAVENARGTSLQTLGDDGNLQYTDGHLQEGLPCMIGAYAATIKILELCGLAYKGIMGEGTVPTTSWLSNKNIPNPQGTSCGATTANCYIAQKCAVAAIKNPYQVTTITE